MLTSTNPGLLQNIFTSLNILKKYKEGAMDVYQWKQYKSNEKKLRLILGSTAINLRETTAQK